MLPRACGALLSEAAFSEREIAGLGPAWLLQVAISVATRVHVLHHEDHIICSIEPNGILVDRHGTCCLLDLLTTQFTTVDGVTFYGEGGLPNFSAPEAMDAHFPNNERGQDQDAFVLCLLLHMLFRNGLHPYDSYYIGKSDGPSLEEKIRDGIWAESGLHPHFRPKRKDFMRLPKTLRDLFERMFVTGHRNRRERPNATDLLVCLQQLQAPSNMVGGSGISETEWSERFPALAQEKPAPPIRRRRRGLMLGLCAAGAVAAFSLAHRLLKPNAHEVRDKPFVIAVEPPRPTMKLEAPPDPISANGETPELWSELR